MEITKINDTELKIEQVHIRKVTKEQLLRRLAVLQLEMTDINNKLSLFD